MNLSALVSAVAGTPPRVRRLGNDPERPGSVVSLITWDAGPVGRREVADAVLEYCRERGLDAILGERRRLFRSRFALLVRGPARYVESAEVIVLWWGLIRKFGTGLAELPFELAEADARGDL